jgi:transposase
VPLIAEVIDAVVGGDTHRDTHALEMTAPTGATIATIAIDNDEAGFAEALAWIAEHTPGSRVVIGLEGTRSYGIGLARAVQAAGLVVVEVERPRRPDRRRGKSDPIDAHLAALHVLRLDADQLPTPRADGDREALRILLGARRELTMVRTMQINRLRALLLTGDEADRRLSRGTLSDARLSTISRRPAKTHETMEASIRRAEARRLAIAIREAGHELKQNKKQLAAMVDDLAPRLQANRCRPRQRSSSDRVLVPLRPVPQRRGLRCAGRSEPHPGKQRSCRPAPLQPRRRSQPQPRIARHHAHPLANLPPHPRLHRPTTGRGQERQRDPPQHQALHRPRALPDPGGIHGGLTPHRSVLRVNLSQHSRMESSR